MRKRKLFYEMRLKTAKFTRIIAIYKKIMQFFNKRKIMREFTLFFYSCKVGGCDIYVLNLQNEHEVSIYKYHNIS